MKKRMERAISNVYEEIMNMSSDEFNKNLEIHKKGEVAEIVIKSGLLKSKHYKFDIDKFVKYTLDLAASQKQLKNLVASVADDVMIVDITTAVNTSSAESELQVGIA